MDLLEKFSGSYKITFVSIVYIVFLLALGVVSSIAFDDKLKDMIGWIELGLGIGGTALLISWWAVWRGTVKKAHLPQKGNEIFLMYIVPWLVMGWGIIYSVLAIVKKIEKDSDIIQDLNITMMTVSLILAFLGVVLFVWYIRRHKGRSRRYRSNVYERYDVDF